jgi:hypothetical protein
VVGGANADHFAYSAVTDSGPGSADKISGFVQTADVIDLSAIDANQSLKKSGFFLWRA